MSATAPGSPPPGNWPPMPRLSQSPVAVAPRPRQVPRQVKQPQTETSVLPVRVRRLTGSTNRVYRQRRRDRGKKHDAALICLTRHRYDILFAILRTGAQYQHSNPVPHPNQLDGQPRDTAGRRTHHGDRRVRPQMTWSLGRVSLSRGVAASRRRVVGMSRQGRMCGRSGTSWVRCATRSSASEWTWLSWATGRSRNSRRRSSECALSCCPRLRAPIH